MGNCQLIHAAAPAPAFGHKGVSPEPADCRDRFRLLIDT